MATLAGQMFVHVALAWWHRRGLSLGRALRRGWSRGQHRDVPARAVLLLWGPSSPCSSSSAAQVLLAPHGGCSKGCPNPTVANPDPSCPGSAAFTPCPWWGAALSPPPCHQHGHQPGLCPKISLPLPQPPFLSEVSPLLQRCGMEPAEQHWLHEAFRRGSPQAGTHRDSWDNLKTRAGT